MADDYKVKVSITAEGNAQEEIEKLNKRLDALEKQMKGADKTSSSFFGSMKAGAIAMGSLVADAVKKMSGAVKQYVSESITLAENYNTLASSFQYLSDQAGISSNEMLQALKRVSQGTATETSLMEASNKAMALGVAGSIEQMTQLMEIAMVKGQEFGETTEQAFNDMITGLGRNSAMILDNLGIIVDSDEAYKNYAESIGKSVDALTEQEQKQALVNEVIKNSQSDLEQYNKIAVSGIQRLNVAFEELQTSIGQVLLGGVQEYANKGTDLIEKYRDLILDVVEKIWNTVRVVIDEIIKSTSNLISWLGDACNGVWTTISGLMNLIAGKNSETTTGIAGDWTDVFYILQLGFTGAVEIVRSALSTIVSVIKLAGNNIGTLVGYMTEFWSTAWKSIQNGAKRMATGVVNSVVDVVNGIVGKLNRLSDQIYIFTGESLGKLSEVGKVDFGGGEDSGFKNTWTAMMSDIGENFEEFGQSVKGTWSDSMNSLLDIYQNKIAPKIEETSQTVANSVKDIFGGDGAGGSSSGGGIKKSAEDTFKALDKEMSDYGKETKKKLTEKVKAREEYYDYITKEQKKAIDKLNDGYEDSFNEVSKLIESTEKEIQSIENEIDKLNSKLSELKGAETTSIAKEFVKAKNELKKLEDEYEGLSDIANSVTYEDLEGIGGIGKYDVDLIKQYKKYQDEMTSAYAGMSEQEAQALTKEIEYQEYYDSLNGVEKIKEDYRIKQEEIQKELDAKISSLNQEQDLLRNYNRERDVLQKQWMNALEVEIKKYEEMEKKKEEFEKKYMDILYQDQQQQIKRYEQLIQKAEELARARERAARAGDGGGSRGTRATGGPVYSGNEYLVGEQGPELFIPSSNGKIVKNSDLENVKGGDVNINLNMGGVVISNGSDEETFARNIIDRITRELQLQKKGLYI